MARFRKFWLASALALAAPAAAMAEDLTVERVPDTGDHGQQESYPGPPDQPDDQERPDPGPAPDPQPNDDNHP